MRYTGPFSTLNLMMMPQNENTCIYNDEFVLADNFYSTESPTDLSADSATAPFITSSYPFKIEFTMAMICLNGYIRAQLNLTEYELRRNNILVVQPGDIGQCLEISPDCRVAIIAFSDNKLITEYNPQGAVAIRKYLSATSLLPHKKQNPKTRKHKSSTTSCNSSKNTTPPNAKSDSTPTNSA